MTRKNPAILIIALVACLLVRDVVACLNYIPGYFVFAEILEEKENTAKNEKEGKKEADESKIPVFLASVEDLRVSTPSIPISEGLKHSSPPYEILYPPPNQA